IDAATSFLSTLTKLDRISIKTNILNPSKFNTYKISPRNSFPSSTYKKGGGTPVGGTDRTDG
ncbi:MAG TPA: hypothetical protein VK805_08595, partial [Candidatus Baltobacteraceae bacterium]|nr:hypothetical protein [Candidatus Baltobacteraceae bacterium]